MSQLRRNPDAASNYFDKLFEGLGHRGSSVADIDSIVVNLHWVHDDRTDRILIFEFKKPGEIMTRGQWRGLSRVVRISPQIDAWALRYRSDSMIEFLDVRRSKHKEIISPEECQRRYQCWWNRKPYMAPVTTRLTMMDAKDIRW